MKNEWTAFRITLLLYIGVLMTPIVMYRSYALFAEVQSTETALEAVNKIAKAAMAQSALPDQTLFNASTSIAREHLAQWVKLHEEDPQHVGGGSLVLKYAQLDSCWQRDAVYTKERRLAYLQCVKLTSSFMFSIEKMLQLKLAKLRNLMTISIVAMVLFLLLLIFLVRMYIEYQLKKHAIIDLETKLYNKQYLEASLDQLASKIKRNNQNAAVIALSIDQLDKESTRLSKKAYGKKLHEVASVFWEVTRNSDIAGRYSDHRFIIVLPETSPDGADKLLKRLQAAFAKQTDCQLVAATYSFDGTVDSKTFLADLLH